LIPRINGFELLMASYAMAHLKLDLLLNETGFKPTKNQRLHIYLTNSLEEHHPDTGTLFARWLSDEANEANHIKRDTPVMCVIGNPPYAVSSSNASLDKKGKKTWIGNLIVDYKKDLNERKINLDDDYIKFIRFGQHFIDKNGEGILAYISNNSFIDGITHRQMRKHLLESFDKIYILDLHGNSKKKEVCPDGSPDQNVFDIMQGVSINIFIKTKQQKGLGKVKHYELYGKRNEKYDFLNDNSLDSVEWNELDLKQPNLFFVKKDFKSQAKYNDGFMLFDLFSLHSTGIESKCDNISIQFSEIDSTKVLEDFQKLSEVELEKKYQRKNSDGWNYKNAIGDIKHHNPQISNISYRPFDKRFTLYTGQSGGFMGRPRSEVMNQMLFNNIAICSARSSRDDNYKFFITDQITDKSISSSLDNIYISPLYLYPEAGEQIEEAGTTPSLFSDTPPLKGGELLRVPNLNTEIVKQIADKLQLEFEAEKTDSENTFAPIDILDYIYAVLHSPSYREKYKEFLKIDFPRVPYPKDKETFWKLVNLGGEIRQIHLLESAKVTDYITQYPIDGDNVVGKVRFEPLRPADTSPCEGEELSGSISSSNTSFQTQFETKSSPPVLGGVDAFRGRGGNPQINNLPHLKTFRKDLRNNLTPAEAKFWTIIKNKQFEGRKFRRQHSVGNYILDFYCPAEKLAIELDGQVHFNDSAREYDYERKLFLEQFGIKVLRFENKRVFEDLEWMLDVIKSNFGWSEKAQPPRPSDTPPFKGGELIGRVWINETQYFDNVPEIAWNFYVGGYQPAQKWLKDRKERTLNFEDIFHYQKIIVALTETDKLMKEIDLIEIE
jgi:predicted helicase/very-short-patch-repair endonuclease